MLRGMLGRQFEITLLMPATPEQKTLWREQIQGVCDVLVSWEPPAAKPRVSRVLDLLDDLPANVVADRQPAAMLAIERQLTTEHYDVVVFDFVHASVLRPSARAARQAGATVCFTHNVETEIFRRHAETARQWWARLVWRSQAQKMARFEATSLQSYDAVVAVSERDRDAFRQGFGVRNAHAIPTGVDLDFFSFEPGPEVSADAPPVVVFTGSMDWDANIDGVRFFIREVWPQVLERCPEARFDVVGRHPPPALVREAQDSRGVRFTGFVDDVRTYVRQACAFVIPLRVGGGTRIKAFEAMAMGCPVVSTSIGIEGLGVSPNVDYLEADDAAAMAQAILGLVADKKLRDHLAGAARRLVEDRYGHQVAAIAFEAICMTAASKRSEAESTSVPARPTLAAH